MQACAVGRQRIIALKKHQGAHNHENRATALATGFPPTHSYSMQRAPRPRSRGHQHSTSARSRPRARCPSPTSPQSVLCWARLPVRGWRGWRWDMRFCPARAAPARCDGGPIRNAVTGVVSSASAATAAPIRLVAMSSVARPSSGPSSPPSALRRQLVDEPVPTGARARACAAGEDRRAVRSSRVRARSRCPMTHYSCLLQAIDRVLSRVISGPQKRLRDV